MPSCLVDRAAGNYRLQAASPAIEAGRNADAMQAWDLGGAPRIQDGHGRGAAVVDMGAYEFAPDSDHDGTVDWQDPDDDNDGAPDAGDCAPFDATTWNHPVEPGDVRLSGDTPALVEWADQDPGPVFDVAGGSVAELLADAGFGRASCRANDHPAPPWSDDEAGPAVGEARWYLVRPPNVCGVGTWGSGSEGADPAIAARP